jgi:hypothetical protein
MIKTTFSRINSLEQLWWRETDRLELLVLDPNDAEGKRQLKALREGIGKILTKAYCDFCDLQRDLDRLATRVKEPAA